MRKVNERWISIVLSILLMVVVFTGCQKEQGEPATDTGGKETSETEKQESEVKKEEQKEKEDEPKPGGELRLATNWPFPFHGSPFGPDGVGGAWWFVYEPFAYYIPETGEYIPRLAESWETEGNKVTIHLRKDAKFSDGEPFTSEDVVKNVYLVQAMWSWPYEIESVENPDDNTVIFTLTSNSFLHSLLTDGAMASLAPAHVYADFTDLAKEVAELGKEIFYMESEGKTVSEDKKSEYESKSEELMQQIDGFKVFEKLGELPAVGTYTPVKVTQTEMEMQPNEYHWTYKDQKIDKIIFKKWSSNEFVWASLISNEIDAAHPSMPKDVVEQLSTLNANIDTITASDLGEHGLVFNFRNPLFQDVNLRKAIAHILERDKIRDVAIWQAYSCEEYAHGILTSMSEQWLTDETMEQLSKYNHDTGKAEQILNDAGYKKDGDKWLQPNGEPVAFTFSVYAPHNDWVLASKEIVQQLNDFGFKVEMELIPEGMRDQVMQAGDYEIAFEDVTSWQGFPHPLTGYQRLYDGNVAQITDFPAKEKHSTPWGELSPYDLILELQKNVEDEDKASELVQQLAYITNENLPVIPCYEKVLPIFINDGNRVTGWLPEDDPIWSLAAGGVERVYNLLISDGKIEPIK